MDQHEAIATLGVGREAVWIRGRESMLAGWVHRPEDSLRQNGCGLLICNPVGHELIHAHQSIREMADSFARAGYTVLRFDYTGTGDSGGDEFVPDIVDTWKGDVLSAAEFLRVECGAEVKQVLAVRSGTLLAAACAAELAPANGLLLWDPIPAGQRFIRELRANEKMAYFRCAPELLESVGFPYPDGMLEGLGKLQVAPALAGIDIPIVAFTRDTSPVPAAIAKIGNDNERFAALQVPGLEDMLVEPHNAVIPRASIDQAVEWAVSQIGSSSAAAAPGGGASRNEATHCGDDDGIVETVMRVSENGGTGILCRSEHPDAELRPIVLLGNAGSIYHIGPNRLYVMLARRLARAGFTSFRYDLPNMGDGLQTPHPEANYPYPADAVSRISEVIEFARQTLGHSSVILTGVCSGATQAFLAALAEQSDSALTETAMVNPKVFYVEDIFKDDSNLVMRRASYYSRAISDPDRWRRLFTGQIDYRQLVSFLLRRTRQQARTVGRRVGRLLGMGPFTRLGRDLRQYMRTGRRLSFFFSSRDPGLRVLLESSDGVARKLIDAKEVPVAIIEDADHTMIAKRCREDFMGKFVAHLETGYPGRS